MYRQQRGLTLLELMITIAIVGVLAAVAIPSYERYSYRAKAAEVVLVLDKIRTALAGIESETARTIGKDMLIRTEATGKRELLYTMRSNSRTGSISGVSNDDLDLKRLGVEISVLSGWANTDQAGQYKITLAWVTTGRSITASQQQARQLVLATLDVMRAHAYKSQIGSSFATLYFSLH
ncbi:MAG: pilin [Rhodoferax sp.]